MTLKIHRVLVSTFLTWVALGISSSILVGYITGSSQIISWSSGDRTAMSIPAATCFILLSVALLLRTSFVKKDT